MAIRYWDLLWAVAPIFAIIITGFIIRRKGWLNREADQDLLRITVNLLYPCLIFDSIIGNPALEEINNVVLPPIVGFGTILIGYMFGLAGARLLRLEGAQMRTFAFVVGIYNYGYIPIPLVQTLFGRETMGVLFTYNLGVEIAFWTGSIFILAATSKRGDWLKIFNAPVLAIIIAVLLNFSGFHHWLPPFLLKTFHMVGQSAVPVALILTGATLADLMIERQKQGNYFAVAGASIIRLGLLPFLFLLLARYLSCSMELKQTLVIQAAMPAGLLPIVLAKYYGGDANLALQIVLSTTVLGLLTIPFWIRFGFQFIGI